MTPVQYTVPLGATPIGGLRPGAVYTVLDAGENLIRLGSVFDASAVDPLQETITFQANHGFVSGDCVYYDRRTGVSILAPWQTAQANASQCANTSGNPNLRAFFVRVIDATTIKLTTTLAATAPGFDDAPFDVTVSGNTVVFGTLPPGLAVNSALIYRAPVVIPVTTGVVDVELVEVDGQLVPRTVTTEDPRTTTTVHIAANNNIFIGNDLLGTLSNGDAVRYVLEPGAVSVGLTSGATYFVIKGANGLIQLASSYCLAVGTAGDAACVLPDGADEGDEPDPIAVTALELTTSAGRDGDEHSLERSIGGLVDGQTYYVRSIDGTAVELALTRGGPAITLDASRRAGPHGFGIVEVDLHPGSGPGPQALFVRITSAGTGELRAPSGALLSSVSPPAGNGKSEATAQGGQGGLGSFDFPSATMKGSPSVTATLAAVLLQAGFDVELAAVSAFDVSSNADAAGGGGLSVGKAVASTNLGDSPTNATIAGSTTLRAGRNVTVLASNDHTLSSTARSVGGGAISGKIAFTEVDGRQRRDRRGRRRRLDRGRRRRRPARRLGHDGVDELGDLLRRASAPAPTPTTPTAAPAVCASAAAMTRPSGPSRSPAAPRSRAAASTSSPRSRASTSTPRPTPPPTARSSSASPAPSPTPTSTSAPRRSSTSPTAPSARRSRGSKASTSRPATPAPSTSPATSTCSRSP